ncbi:glycoside hydrolase family 88 protein [Streptomyces sp. 769]|uniref:glycoside hydrolase family 88 protein n=1 Tax=Streptomyces sp. 769 TaxID=1262452 RepID=UPI000581D1D5|nr:glycoside hydrolase family 88 protein [Streptomyces sp. 769]AJC54514.1 glycosyl hydrolase C family 88 [Streptomyces sp. 769]
MREGDALARRHHRDGAAGPRPVGGPARGGLHGAGEDPVALGGPFRIRAVDPAPAPAKPAAIEESVRRITDRAAQRHDDWWWDDALHMAMPSFARLGALRADRSYWDAMDAFYRHTRDAEGGPGLRDAGSGLWYRDKRFLPGGITSPDGRPVLWSRGNGWVAAAHAKVLAVLPDTFGPTAGYRRTLAAQLAALRTAQRPDGFWNVNLADPGHLPGPETGGTAFFTFAMAAAIRSGVVPRGDYLPVAARAWAAMAATAVHPDGFLGYVQNVGDRPESSQPVTYDSTADFGVGAFLLAGTELAALGNSPSTAPAGSPWAPGPAVPP